MTDLATLDPQGLEQLEHTIQTQLKLVREMKQMKKDVEDSEKRMTNLVERVTKEITINYEEQKQIQSKVHTLANQFAKEHLAKTRLNYSDNLFKGWKGLFIRRIHSRIKNVMNVVRYTAVKRESFEDLMIYLDSLSYQSFSGSELNPTPGILKIMEVEGVN
ncbi:ORF6C domain-containing protein [Facklamia sp. P12945]|uniref:ORF6C domain-containing protein n=1 Tax=unclassified Facklamia TaxID=2622293 RepID=UPI003D184891